LSTKEALLQGDVKSKQASGRIGKESAGKTKSCVLLEDTASITMSSGSRSTEESNSASTYPIDAILLSFNRASNGIDGNLAEN